MATHDVRINSASGVGGFLDPPGYPTHTHSIEEGSRHNPRSIMSITNYAESWLPEDIRSRAKALIDAWHANKPALDSDEVQAWIAQVLGYFRNCYRGAGAEPECWHAVNLLIASDPEYAIAHVDEHAGVRLIRRFYPEWTPTSEDFARAKWGK